MKNSIRKLTCALLVVSVITLTFGPAAAAQKLPRQIKNGISDGSWSHGDRRDDRESTRGRLGPADVLDATQFRPVSVAGHAGPMRSYRGRCLQTLAECQAVRDRKLVAVSRRASAGARQRQ